MDPNSQGTRIPEEENNEVILNPSVSAEGGNVDDDELRRFEAETKAQEEKEKQLESLDAAMRHYAELAHTKKIESVNKYRKKTTAEESQQIIKRFAVKAGIGAGIGTIFGGPVGTVAGVAGAVGSEAGIGLAKLIRFAKNKLHKKTGETDEKVRQELEEEYNEKYRKLGQLALVWEETHLLQPGEKITYEGEEYTADEIRLKFLEQASAMSDISEKEKEYQALNKKWNTIERILSVAGGVLAGGAVTEAMKATLAQRVSEAGVNIKGQGIGDIAKYGSDQLKHMQQLGHHVHSLNDGTIAFDYHPNEITEIRNAISNAPDWLKNSFNSELIKSGMHEAGNIAGQFNSVVNKVVSERITEILAATGLTAFVVDAIDRFRSGRKKDHLEEITTKKEEYQRILGNADNGNNNNVSGNEAIGNAFAGNYAENREPLQIELSPAVYEYRGNTDLAAIVDGRSIDIKPGDQIRVTGQSEDRTQLQVELINPNNHDAQGRPEFIQGVMIDINNFVDNFGLIPTNNNVGESTSSDSKDTDKLPETEKSEEEIEDMKIIDQIKGIKEEDYFTKDFWEKPENNKSYYENNFNNQSDNSNKDSFAFEFRYRNMENGLLDEKNKTRFVAFKKIAEEKGYVYKDLNVERDKNDYRFLKIHFEKIGTLEPIIPVVSKKSEKNPGKNKEGKYAFQKGDQLTLENIFPHNTMVEIDSKSQQIILDGKDCNYIFVENAEGEGAVIEEVNKKNGQKRKFKFKKELFRQNFQQAKNIDQEKPTENEILEQIKKIDYVKYKGKFWETLKGFDNPKLNIDSLKEEYERKIKEQIVAGNFTFHFQTPVQNQEEKLSEYNKEQLVALEEIIRDQGYELGEFSPKNNDGKIYHFVAEMKEVGTVKAVDIAKTFGSFDDDKKNSAEYWITQNLSPNEKNKREEDFLAKLENSAQKGIFEFTFTGGGKLDKNEEQLLSAYRILAIEKGYQIGGCTMKSENRLVFEIKKNEDAKNIETLTLEKDGKTLELEKGMTLDNGPVKFEIKSMELQKNGEYKIIMEVNGHEFKIADTLEKITKSFSNPVYEKYWK